MNIKSIIQNLSHAKSSAELKQELHKVGLELKKLNNSIKPQAEQTIKKAEKKYHEVLEHITAAQKQLDTEITKTVNQVKNTAKDMEKQLTQYKKMAVTQKAKLQKMFKSKKAQKTTKKVAKKVSKKVTKKTTRKASK